MIDDATLLTRSQLGLALREAGFPVADKTVRGGAIVGH